MYIPDRFVIPDSQLYPEDNVVDFEYYFQTNYKEEENKSGRVYLPVLWTAFYKRHNYGNDKMAIADLQNFLSHIDKTKKYFTIVQYDDGILNSLDHLNVLVFTMSGPGDILIPLIASPHKFGFPDFERQFLISFIGRNTHPIRNEIRDQLKFKKDCYVSSVPHSLKQYCSIMAQTVFALCPRGYGPSSFRVQEALQYGSIPIVITDRLTSFESAFPIIICNFLGDGNGALYGMYEMLVAEKGNQIEVAKEYLPDIYQKYYTYPGLTKYIIEKLNESASNSHKRQARPIRKID